MKRVLLATAVSTQALIGAANAEENDASRRLEPVIITSAPGPDRSSDELIGNATALDRAQIVDKLASTLGDTLAGEPGVASTFFGQGASRPVLRGLGAERVQVLTNGIGVIDVSAASPDHQVTADGIDADKIEILRGPAALAYGGQAIGGIVNVIDGLIADEVPDQIVGGDLFGAYNSVNEGREFGGRLKIANGPLIVSASASDRNLQDFGIPGFVESKRLRQLEEAEGEAPEEEARGTVENSFTKTRSHGLGVSLIGDRAFVGIALRNQSAQYGLPGGHAHEEEGGGAEEEELPFIDLDQTRYDVRGGISFDGDVLKRIVGTVAVADYQHTEFEAPGEPGTRFDTTGWEARVELDHEIAGFEGAIGLQAQDKELFAEGDEAFITPTDTKSLAVFLYEAREWGSGFGVEGGLRAERLTHDNIVVGEAEYDLISGSAGVHQHLDSGLFMGVQLSYTERAPNETELFAFGPHLATRQFEVGDATLDKERGINAEGSLRWRNDRMNIGANVFATSFSDFIFLTPGTIDEGGVIVDEVDELPVFLFAQDDATFFGGELYAEVILGEGLLGAEWSFEASADYVNAELDSGGNVPFIPPLTLGAEWTGAWRLFKVDAGIEWAGDQNDPGAGQLETDGFTLFHLRGSLDLAELRIGAEGTEAFVSIENLTDEEARLATSTLKDLLPLPGRNVRAGLRLAF